MTRIALVTGANRGIGKEVCRQLAQQGVTTLLTARSLEKARAAAADLALENIVSQPGAIHRVGTGEPHAAGPP
jgi:NAD(P)-dependent dehydrogenase (short-subunit alcohol dehydrogenase family)